MSSSQVASAIFASAFLLAACSDSTATSDPETSPAEITVETSTPEDTTEPEPEPTEEETPEETEPPVDPNEPVGEFTMISGGDILIHDSVRERASRGDGTYDFASPFEPIQDWIAGADIAICSLEVPITPEGQSHSGYPTFGAPVDLIEALASVGFDGCNIATNHTMDKGFAGIEQTIGQLEAHGMGFAGASRTEEEFLQSQFYTLEVGGETVDVAHISASILTNGLWAEADKPWSWFVTGPYGPYDTIDVIEAAQRARAEGADLVVVSQHWGREYENYPIDEQTEMAAELAASGEVDLVFGNHSHVPQPIVELDGGPNGEGMWVIWSMGNLYTGQIGTTLGPGVTTGVLATATIDVFPEGRASVRNLEWTSVTMDFPGQHMYPLTDLLEGAIPPELQLTAAQLQERADVTYPVMEEGGHVERRTPPVPQADSMTLDRR